MSDRNRHVTSALIVAVAAAGFATTGASAQVSGTSGSATSGASDPNPYYIGVSEALTHDSNVYRIPSGPSDNYSSTSLLGGFDQRLGRQRLFGRASVSANRYQDQDQLNNVGYALNGGLDWETIERLSGNLNITLNRSLAPPAASAGTPVATRNIADTAAVDARARWGGASILTLEGDLGYSRLDYSAPAYASSETNQTNGSVALYYRPGGPLRLGVAARLTRTRTPRALVDPDTGGFLATTQDGRNLDLLADYDLTGFLTANARLSYTHQTNSGIGNADFSGVTGSIALNWSPTGKTTIRFDAARDAGFNATPYNTFTLTQSGSSIALTPVVGLYENNQITNSAGLALNYAATAKISATASARYVRARLTTVNAATTQSPDGTDITKGVGFGANYEITRSWGLACNVGHESRAVSGGVAYSYTANTVGCSTQFTWR